MAVAHHTWSSVTGLCSQTFVERIGASHMFIRWISLVSVLVLTGGLLTPSGADAVRIKDIGMIEGVRENQLLGYGLVVGLDSTGDRVIGGQFTIQAMMSMLNKMGVNLVIDPIQLLTRNIASVMVTVFWRRRWLG